MATSGPWRPGRPRSCGPPRANRRAPRSMSKNVSAAAPLPEARRNHMRCIRLLLRRAATIFAASLAFALAPGVAHAGCGTIWTANLTDHWMWVTIYDLAKTDHYD